jgi:hypothetical protein
MRKTGQARLLTECAVDEGGTVVAPGAASRSGKRVRSVTVNLAESPLGWLLARGHVTPRQFVAGERLRAEWERAQLAPGVTMHWDSASTASVRGGSRQGTDLTARQIDARDRFDAAVAAAGPGLADILWRVVCSGEGMREAESALGWPARAGKLVLRLALDRIADFYRVA